MSRAPLSAEQGTATDEHEPGTDERQRPVVALGTLDLLVSLLGLGLLVGAYWFSLLPEALALLVVVLAPLTVVSRMRDSSRGRVQDGLLRRPLRRGLRPFVLQCVHRWLFWALFGAAIWAGTFALVPAQIGSLLALPLPDRIPYRPLQVALVLGALTMAALALVPRRRVQVATNVLMAVATLFLAVQLERSYAPPADAVTVDLPLAGEWDTVAAGRSVLLSHHYSFTSPQVRDALDFVRVVDGRGHDGDPERAESWYGFGEPVLAPADGRVVSVSDVFPDEPVGKTGVTPAHGNHIVLEIGPRRHAVMAHLRQGSARVSAGERVRLGQQVAEVGDSGNSLWPHLHFHVQEGTELDARARTVPVEFRGTVLTRNGRTSTPPVADLRRGDRVRPVERLTGAG